MNTGKRTSRAISFLFAAAAALHGTASVCKADEIYMFNLIPSNGAVSGVANSTVGWGYSITNESPTDWLLTTDLEADAFAYGTADPLFDFPEVAPGATVTEPFSALLGTGLYQLTWDANAPGGFFNAGNFVLSAQWFDGDPFNGGSFISDATDLNSAYSAAVTPSSVPEPASIGLIVAGLLVLLFRSRTARIGVLITALWGVLAAQEEAKDSAITRQQADDILLELRAIHESVDRLLRPTPVQRTPPPAYPTQGRLRLDGEPFRGSISAPVTMVEFVDYQCPFCRHFESTVLPEIVREYVDTGRVRLVVHDSPLVIHHDAASAAEAAHCAGDQGQFWPMHDALFQDQGELGADQLVGRAESLNLDVTEFRNCLNSGRNRKAILKQVEAASALRINATPAFLIGKTDGDVVDGVILVGAQPIGVFESKLNQAEAGR